ncbi:hypothetical protein [Stutzerimonas degradans]|uniref:hypothetical protein n=1 Tax=Stutzerimonas degradans TaxID=2968968 RepID=UPI00141E2BD2|nr:hypothetical protein [Stutzerimonas degradans]NHW01965.1 hypothetical protein [Stutzerimonas degradans]
MSWRKEDNKNYRGKIDRIYVSMTEQWEVEYFVDTYLRYRKAELTDDNRGILLAAMEKYDGKAPVKREELIAYLDRNVK